MNNSLDFQRIRKGLGEDWEWKWSVEDEELREIQRKVNRRKDRRRGEQENRTKTADLRGKMSLSLRKRRFRPITSPLISLLMISQTGRSGEKEKSR